MSVLAANDGVTLRDTLPALWLRNGRVGGALGNRTILVTADTSITFTFGNDLSTGMQFTLSEWREIVDFISQELSIT